ncbi:MAG: DNA topoisomerase, partial [Kiritimatiellae bacterium]|nr:DNA topoisomerase [Kiritimatiellia bacterium]
MSKQLIIAEKPSVAADIAKALGGFSKKGEFFESEAFVLSSAVGHLLAIVVPEGQEVKRGKWNLVNLPIIPTHFDLRPIERSAPRLKILLRLIKRPDVDALVNACDAGREGELIFRYIAQFAGIRKPIRRLWLQSMTQGAIREAFAALRADADMQPLADAAVCRSEADWLVGINGTRAMTAFNSKLGGFQLTTVGRVQTPTLMIVVEREEKIKKYVPRDYWELHAAFQAAAGDYSGRWFDEAFPKGKSEVHPPMAAPEATRDGDAKPERLWDAARAEAIRAKCLGKSGV